ncbi:hypothetical protein EDD18DRAFT_1146834 [Armillaria luteobubalina]|uniref:C2H2-type domain-containing protein n=1 Tax=Armillaria luteobubalina TaxID=153913 RepID=A0AA39QG83_9AGAR|nr:hypothetical protein EDD18DRAFT_1146834 [Armillaria luteobubalina]
MLLPRLSWKTLPTDLLHLCTQFTSTITRKSQRGQGPECHTSVSCSQDLTEHIKANTKTAENYRVCPDCPILLQTCNLDGHRLRHHSGNEKFTCTEDPGCLWGGSTKDELAHHRRKYHGKAAPNGDAVSQTPYGNEPTDNPPPSLASSSLDLHPPVDGMKRPTAEPIVSPKALFDGQAQGVTRDEDVGYVWTSSRTGFKHGDPCYSPEAIQLFPADNAGPLHEGLDDISSLGGGALDGADTSEVPVIHADPLALMEEAMAAMNTINMLVSAEAPVRSYYDTAHPTHPKPSSWDDPNL